MSARLHAYRQAIADTIKQAMPQLKECEALSARFDLEQLTSRAIRAPAVFVVLLRSPLKRGAHGGLDADARVVIFAVTQGREEDRETQAFVIGEAIAVLADVKQMWGQTHIGPVEDLDIEQVHAAALDKKGVACIAVGFRQRVSRVGAGLFDDEMKLPTDLYLGGELIDHVDPPGSAP